MVPTPSVPTAAIPLADPALPIPTVAELEPLLAVLADPYDADLRFADVLQRICARAAQAGIDCETLWNDVPWVTSLYARFMLEQSPVGSLNVSLDGFEDWFETYYATLVSTVDGTPEVEHRPEAERARRHLNQQVYLAIFEPESQISQTLRLLEQELTRIDADEAAWSIAYLILDPDAQRDLLSATDGALIWDRLLDVIDAFYDQREDAEPIATNLLEYLRVTERGLMFIDRHAAGVQHPAAGALLYDRSMCTWGESGGRLGVTDTTDTGLRISVLGDLDYMYVGQELAGERFGDVHATVLIRAHAPAAERNAGCLMFRMQRDRNRGTPRVISYCLFADGSVGVHNNTLEADATEYTLEVIREQSQRLDVDPRVEDVELGVTARGEQVQFHINGRMVDEATIHADVRGAFGIGGANDDLDTRAVWDFSTLRVWSAQAAGTP